MIKEVRINQTFMPVQIIDVNPKYIKIAQNFITRQTTRINRISVSITQSLRLNHDIKIRTSIKHISINQKFQLQQHGSRGDSSQITDFLFMWHEIKTPFFERLKNHLNLTQILEANTAKAIFNNLVMQQMLSLNTIRERTLEQFFSLQQSVIVWTRHHRVILIGETQLEETNHIVLKFENIELKLRNPSFGDSQTLHHSRINRKNRGGDIIIYRDSKWPKKKTFRMSFSLLKEKDIQNFLFFIEISLGKQLFLTDYEGRIWKGIITTPSNNVIQQGRSNYQIDFEFEGELI